MVEPILSGIVLGLIPITILGLLVDAYLQYRHTHQLLAKLEDTDTKKRSAGDQQELLEKGDRIPH